jgi:aryl-alcohol dehydrogenase-like predicted oxidoreductase
LLTGKYKKGDAAPADTRFATLKGLADRYATEANWQIVSKLEQFCEQRGHSMLELAFSWLAARPTVASVIAGATKPEQLEQNVAAVGWALSPEDMGEIDRLTAK